jgi:hypothetical protein
LQGFSSEDVGSDDERTLPHLPFGCFCLRLKKEKNIFWKSQKKILWASS